jgi:hypothetical protein
MKLSKIAQPPLNTYDSWCAGPLVATVGYQMLRRVYDGIGPHSGDIMHAFHDIRLYPNDLYAGQHPEPLGYITV